MTMLKNLLLGTAAAIALTVAVAPPQAQAAPAIISFTQVALSNAGDNIIIGWEFSVVNPISVSALGAFDWNRDGMGSAHDIGIFRKSNQSLVMSARLESGLIGVLDGDYRYQFLAGSVGLAPGDYVIVMTAVPDLDPFFTAATAVTTATDIIWRTSAFAFGSVLAYPVTFGLFDGGWFGPNFQIDAAQVPVPASMALLGAGLAGLGLARRRRG